LHAQAIAKTLKDIANKVREFPSNAIKAAADVAGKIPVVGGIAKAVVNVLGQILCPTVKINIYNFLRGGLAKILQWAAKPVELIIEPLFKLLKFPSLVEIPGLDFLDALNPPSFSFEFDLDFLGADVFPKIKVPMLSIGNLWEQLSQKLRNLKADTCSYLLAKRQHLYRSADDQYEGVTGRRFHEQVSGWILKAPQCNKLGFLPNVPAPRESPAPAPKAPFNQPKYNPANSAPVVKMEVVGGRAPGCMDDACTKMTDQSVDCSIEPPSVNGPAHPKGCAGAVYSNGKHAQAYCAGDGGRFPWLMKCCKWVRGACTPKDPS